jgi:16S rRNA (guanine966-N2)-methyltransferase
VASKSRASPPPSRSGYSGEIRIIGGQWRRRRLPVLVSEGLRPTPDRVRETVFNWLAPHIVGSQCLDLFSGTGALCLEALSRGAARAVMVERAPEAAQQLRANVDLLKTTAAEIVCRDALHYLAGTPTVFDIVFLDPPFADAEPMIRRCSQALMQGWVKPGTLIYVEAPRDFTTLPLPAGWDVFKTGTAGQVGFHLARVPPAK